MRDWLNAREVRQWDRRHRLPPTVDRTYWSAYEYQRDLGRLQALRYNVTSQRSNLANPAVSIDIAATTMRSSGLVLDHRLRRIPVVYRVSYARLSFQTWASTVEAAERRASR